MLHGLFVCITLWPAAANAAPAGPSTLGPVASLLASSNDVKLQRDVLRGLYAGLHGRRGVAMPSSWPAALRKLLQTSDEEVRELSLEISLVFGDLEAVRILRRTSIDRTAPAARREAAVYALLYHKDPELLSILKDLLNDAAVRRVAVRALSAYRDADVPRRILADYRTYSAAEKADAINTLAARVEYARALVTALESGVVPRSDLDSFTVRQLHGLNDRELSRRLNHAWGTIRSPSKERALLTAQYKRLLTPQFLRAADLSNGRAVFQKNCATCHRLFDSGGRIGPELTGGQRTNLDYVLENLIDPSAVVPRDYQVTILATRDGRVLNGIIRSEDDHTIALQTPNELITLAKEDVEARKRSPLSLMPEGMMLKLKDEEIRDLVGYLAAPAQVAPPIGM